MKNIYSLGSRITKEDFRLNIYYSNPSPINYIQAVDQSSWPEDINGKTLLSLFNFDNLNMNNDVENGGDGFFDFVPNITVDTNNGLVIFTSIEPFGKYLFDKLKSSSGSSENYENLASYNMNQKKYVYNEIYSQSKTVSKLATAMRPPNKKASQKQLGRLRFALD